MEMSESSYFSLPSSAWILWQRRHVDERGKHREQEGKGCFLAVLSLPLSPSLTFTGFSLSQYKSERPGKSRKKGADG